jgi:hypothetical protein
MLNTCRVFNSKRLMVSRHDSRFDKPNLLTLRILENLPPPGVL